MYHNIKDWMPTGYHIATLFINSWNLQKEIKTSFLEFFNNHWLFFFLTLRSTLSSFLLIYVWLPAEKAFRWKLCASIAKTAVALLLIFQL